MEKELRKHHKNHFSQAKDTPFNKQLLKNLTGFTAEGPLAAQLKEVTANLVEIEVDDYTKGILHKLNWKPLFPPKADTELQWEYVKHVYKI
eukprot:8509220-Ditylum_brightwellii.AAC.1